MADKITEFLMKYREEQMKKSVCGISSLRECPVCGCAVYLTYSKFAGIETAECVNKCFILVNRGKCCFPEERRLFHKYKNVIVERRKQDGGKETEIRDKVLKHKRLSKRKVKNDPSGIKRSGGFAFLRDNK